MCVYIHALYCYMCIFTYLMNMTTVVLQFMHVFMEN